MARTASTHDRFKPKPKEAVKPVAKVTPKKPDIQEQVKEDIKKPQKSFLGKKVSDAKSTKKK